MDMFPVLALGFLLGMRHATDSDHIVAVTTIVSREKSIRAAGLIGAMWGLGHSAAILLVGGAIVLFGVVLPARVGLAFELAVAVMLILLGAFNILGGVRGRVRGREGTEPSRSAVPSPARAFGGLRPLLVGTVHGLAGSAAVALLVLTTIRTPLLAVIYLVLFGIGTLAGMMLITTAMALPLALAARKVSAWSGHIGLVTGLFSVAFGLLMTYHIGFVDGLFRPELHLPQ
jgi:high-affinity nickel-transport protein